MADSLPSFVNISTNIWPFNDRVVEKKVTMLAVLSMYYSLRICRGFKFETILSRGMVARNFQFYNEKLSRICRRTTGRLLEEKKLELIYCTKIQSDEE